MFTLTVNIDGPCNELLNPFFIYISLCLYMKYFNGCYSSEHRVTGGGAFGRLRNIVMRISSEMQF